MKFKKLVFAISLLTTIYFVANSQVNYHTDTLHNKDTVFFKDFDPNVRYVDQIMPEFPGGSDSLMDFMRKNLVYPKNLIKDKVEGMVMIKFSVNNKGIAGEIGFVKTLHPEIEKQCIEVINKLPKFKPGEGFNKSEKGWYWGPNKAWYVFSVYYSPTEKIAINNKLVIAPKIK